MDIQDARLSDPLLVAADWENADDIAYAVAQAATIKALWWVADWLEFFITVNPSAYLSTLLIQAGWERPA